jgi:Mrp family chromosome partitioning ATPase
VANAREASSMTVERQLDQVVERLSSNDASPATRALLIEARRLRSIIANWRTVPPLPNVREEMLARVLHISAAVGDAVPSSRRARSSSSILAAPQNTTGLNFEQIAAMNGGPSSQPFGSSTSEETVITDGLSALPQTSLDVHPVPLGPEINAHLVMLTDPTGQRADAYRALRHRLAHLGDPKVIGVTSAGRREGKTVAAINLAASLREGARGRVLLLEANTRAPAIAEMLGFTPPICFAEQLLRHRKDPLEPWVAAEPLTPLHVMAVNPTIKHSPLLDPIAFSIAIDRLRMAGYDYIVVDTSPVLESADVNLIADSLDGLVMTVLAKRSDSKSIKRAMNQIGSMTFLGTLLLE